MTSALWPVILSASNDPFRSPWSGSHKLHRVWFYKDSFEDLLIFLFEFQLLQINLSSDSEESGIHIRSLQISKILLLWFTLAHCQVSDNHFVYLPALRFLRFHKRWTTGSLLIKIHPLFCFTAFRFWEFLRQILSESGIILFASGCCFYHFQNLSWIFWNNFSLVSFQPVISDLPGFCFQIDSQLPDHSIQDIFWSSPSSYASKHRLNLEIRILCMGDFNVFLTSLLSVFLFLV